MYVNIGSGHWNKKVFIWSFIIAHSRSEEQVNVLILCDFSLAGGMMLRFPVNRVHFSGKEMLLRKFPIKIYENIWHGRNFINFATSRNVVVWNFNQGNAKTNFFVYIYQIKTFLI